VRERYQNTDMAGPDMHLPLTFKALLVVHLKVLRLIHLKRWYHLTVKAEDWKEKNQLLRTCDSGAYGVDELPRHIRPYGNTSEPSGMPRPGRCSDAPCLGLPFSRGAM